MLLTLISTLALAAPQSAAPRVHNPVIATYQGSQLEIHGREFGLGGVGSRLRVRSGSTEFSIPSTGALITSWDDQKIVMQLPPDAPSGELVVETPMGRSKLVTVHVYEYMAYDIPETAGTAGAPLSIDVDAQHRVWVNQEFHKAFHMLDPAVGVVEQYTIPVFDSPGPFAITLFGDAQTTTSVLGEDVLVDPYGRVWFTQGGQSLYGGIHPNHSRVICVIPDAPGGPEFRAYNVPGRSNEVVGLAWDPAREWIWFTQASFAAGPALVGFDPEVIPYDNHFDFQTSLDHLAAYPGNPQDPVYHFYMLPPDFGWPAHMQFDQHGMLWCSNFWGRSIGRLDPVTGATTKYPVPEGIASNRTGKIVGPGPWEMLLDDNGDIIFNEFFDSTITRFDVSRADDPATWQLDANGLNPGMTDWVVPAHDREFDRIHSMAWGPDGKLWYSIHQPKDSPTEGGSLGFITADFEHRTRFPALNLIPGDGMPGADGIVVDQVTGDIWFCEFFRDRIGRLREVPQLP